MRERLALLVLALLLAVGLAVAWFYLRDDGAAQTNTVAVDDEAIGQDNSTPLEMPESESTGELPIEEVRLPDSTDLNHTDEPDAETATSEPLLDTPDYGVAIRRGGAAAEFELVDIHGDAVSANTYSAALWRRVGNYWIRDEALPVHGSNRIGCLGLTLDREYTGLEPGNYELELSSKAFGSFRHEFSIERGEFHQERLVTPYWEKHVVFHFTRPDGSPVTYLPAIPRNTYTSDSLPEKDHDAAATIRLRTPLDVPEAGGGGMTMWGGHPDSGIPIERKGPNPLYPTRDGCWWVTVQAGATNTVSLRLDAAVWGQAEYTITNTFVTVERIEVVLPTPDDYPERVAEYGEPVKDFPAGNEPAARQEIIEARDKRAARDKFDPYTSELPVGKTRVILEVDGPKRLSAEISDDGKRSVASFRRVGDVFSHDFDSDKSWWYRFVSGPLYCGEWQPLDVTGGGTKTVHARADTGLVLINTDGLTPTLRAFAFSVDLQIATINPDSVGDEPEAKKKAATPEKNPFDYRRQSEDRAAPHGASRYTTLSLRKSNGYEMEALLGGRKVDEQVADARVLVRTHLRGAAQAARFSRKAMNLPASGRYPYEPLILNGRWQDCPLDGGTLRGALESGKIQPSFDDVLVARAVGPKTEGLPWVQGVLVDYADDELAREVREIEKHWQDHPVPPQAHGPEYRAALAAAQEDSGEAALRKLLGDELYERFETDEQRLWYAKNGTWYDGHRKVLTDDQGYIAVENAGLEPGKCYVMYLWSNSKDGANPDARFAFKVDENGVADLGAIHLPTYTD
ncbi:MAG: hypothetical protein KDB82_09180 [Planctomycetes bacterium]|nr:hypothetical protein [Planctomycetota bacterium]